MTANKHFKQLARACMAVAGETYTAARESLLSDEADVVLGDPVVVAVHGRHGQAVVFTPDGTRVLSGGGRTPASRSSTPPPARSRGSFSATARSSTPSG